MAWRTVSRIKKTKVFTNKGNIYLPNMSNGVGWNGSNVSTFLTAISKQGNGLTHIAVTNKNDNNNYNIYTNKTTFSQQQTSHFVMRDFMKDTGPENPSRNVVANYSSGGSTSYIVGVLFIEFVDAAYAYYGASSWRIKVDYDFSFDLYVGDSYSGTYHRQHRSGTGDRNVSYPHNTVFGTTTDDQSRTTSVICLINKPNIYNNGNVELRNFSFTWNNSGNRPYSLFEAEYTVILKNYMCDKLSTSTSDSQCLSIAYEVN